MDLLAHLDAFAAVAEHQSFSDAAEHLHIAQPLLSRRIKNLERRLGDDLFDRSQRQVRITDLGQLLLPHAQDVVSRADHLLSLARSARETRPAQLGIPPECDPAALARLIRIATQHGELITVHELPAREREAALRRGELAAALLHGPPASASLSVTVGVASATRADRVVHLDSLRPRRTDSGTNPLRLLVLPEDDIPAYVDRLTRALAAAGLATGCLVSASSSATAAAEVLGDTAKLVCDQRFAQRHGLAWAPFADRALDRGYELMIGSGPSRGGSPGLSQSWLLPMLAAATGAQQAGPPVASDAVGAARESAHQLAAGA